MSFKNLRASSQEKIMSYVEEQAKINEVRNLIGPPITNKYPTECSDASIQRFLIARNWNSKKATKMLKETLKWRIEYKPDKIQWEDVAHEAATGKLYKANYLDRNGRSVLVIKPAPESANSVQGQIKYLVYCMENAISNLQNGQEQMVWLIDFKKWNLASVPVKVVRETARVLQDYYPERLSVAILYNPPKMFESFWLLVKPFLDHKTYKKVKFVYSDQPQSLKIMEALFDMDKLESSFGGKNKEDFDFEAYAKRMKDEEKSSNDASSSSSDQIKSAVVSDSLVSDLSSEVSDMESDSLSNYETKSELEGLEEMIRMQLDCNSRIADAK